MERLFLFGIGGLAHLFAALLIRGIEDKALEGFVISPDILLTGALALGFCLVVLAYDRIKAWLERPRIHAAE